MQDFRSTPRIAPWLVLGSAVFLSAAWLLTITDERSLSLLWNTLKLSAGVPLIATPLGMAFAILSERTEVPGRRMAHGLLTAMLFVPLFLQAAGWDAAFGRQGWYTLVGDAVANTPLAGLAAAIWIHSLAGIPWIVLIVSAGLRHIDPELEEAALLDLAPLGVLRRVTLPLILPLLFAAGLWVAVLTAGEMTVTDLYQVRTYAEEVYSVQQLLGTTQADVDGGVTLPSGVFCQALLVLVGGCALQVLLARGSRPQMRPHWRFELGAWRIPLAAAMWLIVVLIVAVPLANFVFNAGASVQPTANGLERNWSIVKVASETVASVSRFAPEFRWTAVIAGTAATVCLACAIPLAWFARRGGWRAMPALLVVTVGATLPGPVIGLWIIRWLNRAEPAWLADLYSYSILAPVIATSIRAIPAAMVLAWFGFHSLSDELLEAAEIDSLGPVARFVRVAAPLRWRSLAAAWLAALIVASGDLAASILVAPPGVSTLPIRVFGLLHAGVDDQVAGLCLAITVCIAGLSVLILRLAARDGSGA